MDRLDGDEQPEIAFNREWGASVRAAREALGLSQQALGARVGTSQNMISLTESGGIGSSRFVMRICEELSISPPVFFEDDNARNWHALGQRLRAGGPEFYRRAIAALEGVVATMAIPKRPQ